MDNEGVCVPLWQYAPKAEKDGQTLIDKNILLCYNGKDDYRGVNFIMEINKAFENICDKLERVLISKGFKKESVNSTDKELTALFTGDCAYTVIYYIEKKRIVLRSCSMQNDEPDNEWKTIATWIFDPEVDTNREVEAIGNDFVETVQGSKQAAIIKAQKKKKKDGENNVDPLFFANRMVNFVPELREEIAYERSHYAEFRGITFAEEKIAPKLKTFIASATEKEIEKFSTVLSDLYKSGDLDTKGIITYIILNSLEENDYRKAISQFSDNNKKITHAARKLIGKKIKPEKPKKKKKGLMAATLERQEELYK